MTNKERDRLTQAILELAEAQRGHNAGMPMHVEGADSSEATYWAKRLKKEGLIEASIVEGDQDARRVVYLMDLTAAGRDKLEALRTPAAKRVARRYGPMIAEAAAKQTGRLLVTGIGSYLAGVVTGVLLKQELQALAQWIAQVWAR